MSADTTASVRINLNTVCTFTLTPHGARVWNAKHASFWAAHPEYAKPVTDGVRMQEQFWLLMYSTGHATFMGAPSCVEGFHVDVDLSEEFAVLRDGVRL
jgi:hypothetical protein